MCGVIGRTDIGEAAEPGGAPAGRETWIERYRPQAFDNVYGQDSVVERLHSCIERDDLSHLLSVESAGIGKTISATATARTICGSDWHDDFLGLNASDGRDVGVVRGRIKNFTHSSSGGHDYRVIFLDETGLLTNDAQSALHRMVEQFSDNTRFIPSCNYSSEIIDPIQPRCAVFRFSPLGDGAITEQVRDVAAAEDIEVTKNGLNTLVYAIGGDACHAIDSLQAVATTGEVIDEETVYMITSTARPEGIEEMVRITIDGEFTATRKRLETLIVDAEMAGGDIVNQLHRSVWEFGLDERGAVRLMKRIDEADYRISEGANERVQLEVLLTSFALSQN